jgi:23S rRNA pseudouridine1911/1915/1917 synthase
MNKYQDYISNIETTLLDSIASFKKDLSKKTIKNYIKNEMVTVNKKTITNSSYIVHTNDLITISYNKKRIKEYNLDILYEDDYLIAINKPSGLLSISNDKEKIVTAYRMVSDYVKRNTKNKYIFVVHRLDEDTSGILLFSKDKNIRDKMQDNWNTITKKRGYLAICDGILKGSKTIHTYLNEDHNGFIYSDKHNNGKEAITNYKVIKNYNNYSLLQVFIDTGRRNQIRVHLSELGYPIAGDKKYRCKTNPIKRLCLHANILEFIHPVTKKLIHLESSIPDDMKKLIKKD